MVPAGSHDLINSIDLMLAALKLDHRRHRILHRPTFVRQSTISSAAAATIALIELMQSLTSRYFDGDVARLLQAQAVPSSVAKGIAVGGVGS